MLTQVVLTHPCDTNVHLLAGAWTTPEASPSPTAPAVASGSAPPSSQPTRSTPLFDGPLK